MWTHDRDASKVAAVMAVALALGALLVYAATSTGKTAVAGLLWAAACSSVGWFLGFLFGIPRSLSTDTARTRTPAPQDVPTTGADDPVPPIPPIPPVPPAPPVPAEPVAPSARTTRGAGPSTAVNTNLEQISDWLTKIIVGVTLVENKEVLSRMSDGAELMALSLGGSSEKSLALAILIYFFSAGLLGSYLLTRLFLQRAFTEAAGSTAGDGR